MAEAREIRQLARPVLMRIAPDEAAIIIIPGDQPYNRIAYQTIGGMAHALWGAGMYRLRMERGSNVVQVRRLSVKARPMRRRLRVGPI